jgi:hypothetical protein
MAPTLNDEMQPSGGGVKASGIARDSRYPPPSGHLQARPAAETHAKLLEAPRGELSPVWLLPAFALRHSHKSSAS